MRLFSIAMLTSLLALAGGCQTKGDDNSAADQQQAKADSTHAKAADAKAAPGGGDDKTADLAKDDHGSHPIAAGEGAVNPHGPLDEKLGQALAGAEVVDVAKLVSDPDAFDGKTVTLTGEVTDMCHHKRGWFAVASPDGKKMVRVITGPGKFQVPVAAIGATAKAEGAINVVTLNEKQIAYFRRSHKFISDEEARSGKPIKQAILMATGAEFKR